jgi:hypothetical protein
MTGLTKMKKVLAKRALKANKKPAKRQSKQESKAKKITGTVLRIVNGRPTKEKLAAEKAFADLAQAREQVLYAERHGSQEEKRLVRLAFRQYQNMRFRAK